MMTPEAMAALHARAFAGQGRAWSEAEFTDLLNSRHVFAVGGVEAFALGRVIAGEAELLTLATDPDHRRQGLGRSSLLAFEAAARDRGGLSSFLEVARDNDAALTLYLAEGYEQAACRTGYYRRAGQAPVDALVLRKRLG